MTTMISLSQFLGDFDNLTHHTQIIHSMTIVSSFRRQVQFITSIFFPDLGVDPDQLAAIRSDLDRKKGKLSCDVTLHSHLAN